VKRFEALRTIADAFPAHTIVTYAGAACEELYASGDEARFIYVLGSMGLASSIGLGFGLASDAPVVSCEGDGSLLMNLGALVTIGQFAPRAYVLAMIDNGQHASTGGQPTATSHGVDLSAIARAAGCRLVISCTSQEDIGKAAAAIRQRETAAVLHVRVDTGDGPRRRVDLDPPMIRDRARRRVAPPA
jgi:thiamine pyrophosphate-dependent acetolactate synthase large subunit-like protein